MNELTEVVSDRRASRVPDRRRVSATDAWAEVLQHMAALRRIAGALARADRRVGADELAQDLFVDLVESRGLYDPARGPWLAWARTRAWLMRIRMVRRQGRATPLAEEAEGGVVLQDLPGQRGSVARMEAQVELAHLLPQLADDERDALVEEMHGWGPTPGLTRWRQRQADLRAIGGVTR